MEYSPICLFVYNRLSETMRTAEALRNNFLASESNLFIFSDGWKNELSKEDVLSVRGFIKSIEGFKSITIIESNTNKGLAMSIISGVTGVISEHGSAIIVEDDLITSNNFLTFMNTSLTTYKEKKRIFSVSGFCLEIDKPISHSADAFFWGRAHSWGWATWTDRWATVDWSIEDWDEFSSDRKRVKEFNSFGTDLYGMLKKSMLGKINSWYIRFNYSQFSQNGLTVYPFKSKVFNIGFTESATHCDTYNRNSVIFDRSGNRSFEMPVNMEIDPDIRKQLFRYKSLNYRIIGKLLTYLLKFKIIKQKTTGLIK
jgi:hypothetical protein